MPECQQTEELERARELFEAHEPRDLFYRVALDLLERTRAGESDFSVAEPLAVVLQTWNRRFYISKYGARVDSQHFADIEASARGMSRRSAAAWAAASNRTHGMSRPRSRRSLTSVSHSTPVPSRLREGGSGGAAPKSRTGRSLGTSPPRPVRMDRARRPGPHGRPQKAGYPKVRLTALESRNERTRRR